MKTKVLFCLSLLLLACSPLSPNNSAGNSTGNSSDSSQLQNQYSMTLEGDQRLITANGIPNHPTGDFPNAHNPNTISAQNYSISLPVHPEQASSDSELGLSPFGIAVNGVPFDPLAAEFWNNDRNSTWEYEALGNGIDLGTDDSNAHVQPNGAYHYHGMPTGLMKTIGTGVRHYLVGYAMDGFPIYAEYGYAEAQNAQSAVRELKASFRIKSGTRPDGPGGEYDGTFTADYEYVAGSGDLDECNGRVGVSPEYPDGSYMYFITNNYPFIPRCYKGTPAASLRSAPANGGNPGTQTGNVPDLEKAAVLLGISSAELRSALGPPPPDLSAAAKTLGISEDKLRKALEMSR